MTLSVLAPIAAWGLGHGAVNGLAVSLVVSPVGLHLIALTVEGRRLRFHDQYLAFIIGDPLLAVAVAASAAGGVCRAPSPVWQWTCTVTFLFASLILGAREVGRGAYSRLQALSPTKLWHQAVVVPLLGTWVVVGTSAAVRAAPTHPFHLLATLICITTWTLLLVHDAGHPKPAHVPYDWRPRRP